MYPLDDLYTETLTPSFMLLEQMRLARRGVEDGMELRPRASEAIAYSNAYGRGQVLGRAQRMEVVLALFDACVCPHCGVTYTGHIVLECPCKPGAVPERGVYGVYGPEIADEPAEFMSYNRVRQLQALGVRTVTDTGVDISSEFTMLQ